MQAFGSICHFPVADQPFLGFLQGKAFPKGSPVILPQAPPPPGLGGANSHLGRPRQVPRRQQIV